MFNFLRKLFGKDQLGARTGVVDFVGLLDEDDIRINPSTEDKQDDIIAALGGVGAITVNTPAIKSDATALAANANRKGWEIQNLGTNPLFVLKGNGASTTVFHKVVGAGQSNDDGTGGNYSETIGRIYTGIITVAGASPRYVVTEYI